MNVFRSLKAFLIVLVLAVVFFNSKAFAAVNCFTYDSLSPSSGTLLFGSDATLVPHLTRSSEPECRYAGYTCTYTLYGGFAKKTYSNNTGKFNTILMETGVYEAAVSCSWTTSGGTKQATYTIDATPPRISFSNLFEGQTVYGKMTIGIDSVDANRVIFTAGNNLNITDYTPPFMVIDFDTTKRGNGPLSIRAVAVDARGTTNEVTINLIVTNNPPPVPTLTPTRTRTPYDFKPTIQISKAVNIMTGTQNVNITTFDDHRVASMTLYVDDVFIKTFYNFSDSFDGSFHRSTINHPLDTTAFSDGVHILKGIVIDSNGHVASDEVSAEFSNSRPAANTPTAAPAAKTPTPSAPKTPTFAPTKTSTPPAAEPTAGPTEPTAAPVVPTVKPAERTAQPGDPTPKVGVPTVKPGERTPKPSRPTATPAADESDNVAFSVKVIDRESKEPISSATVKFVSDSFEKKVKTDSKGIAELAFRKGTSVSVTVKAKGYTVKTSKIIKLTRDKDMTIKLALRIIAVKKAEK